MKSIGIVYSIQNIIVSMTSKIQMYSNHTIVVEITTDRLSKHLFLRVFLWIFHM